MSNGKSQQAVNVAIKNAIVEMSNAWLLAEGHNTHAKEVAKHIADEYEIDKSELTQLAKLYHKQNAREVKAKSETILEKYQEIFKEDLE